MNKKLKIRLLAVLPVLLLAGGLVVFWLTADRSDKLSVVPTKTGELVYQNERAEIDASNLAEGYLLIRYTGGADTRIRVRIMKDGDADYLYDLNREGEFEVFPLTEGDGAYQVTVYENTSSDKYAAAYRCPVELALRDERLPFLYPNQYVNFSETSEVAAVAETLTKDCSTDLDKTRAVYEYIVTSFTFDSELAGTVQSGYLPDPDATLASQAGICFDYCAVMASMLRSQGVPCKLAVGYAGEVYHSWLYVWIEDEGWLDDFVYSDGSGWLRLDPTFASTGERSEEIMAFILEDGNYVVKFIY